MHADAAVMERPKKTPLQLQQVPVEYLGAVLPHVGPWLISIVERSGRRYTLPVLVDMIARGELQMWLIGDETPRGIVITELYYAPSGLKFAAIRAAGQPGRATAARLSCPTTRCGNPSPSGTCTPGW
jgi:hypothetical protein